MNSLRQFPLYVSFRRWVNRRRIRSARQGVNSASEIFWGTVFIVCVVVGCEWLGNMLLR